MTPFSKLSLVAISLTLLANATACSSDDDEPKQTVQQISIDIFKNQIAEKMWVQDKATCVEPNGQEYAWQYFVMINQWPVGDPLVSALRFQGNNLQVYYTGQNCYVQTPYTYSEGMNYIYTSTSREPYMQINRIDSDRLYATYRWNRGVPETGMWHNGSYIRLEFIPATVEQISTFESYRLVESTQARQLLHGF